MGTYVVTCARMGHGKISHVLSRWRQCCRAIQLQNIPQRRFSKLYAANLFNTNLNKCGHLRLTLCPGTLDRPYLLRTKTYSTPKYVVSSKQNNLENDSESRSSEVKAYGKVRKTDTFLIMESLLTEIQNRKNSLDNDYWTTINGELKERGKRFWPTQLMGLLDSRSAEPDIFNIAQSLYEYIVTQSPQDASIIFVIYFMVLCAGQGYKVEQDLICKLYDDLLRKTDVFDALSTQGLIQALSVTERWRECFSLLEMTNIASTVSRRHCSPVLKAAFRERDHARIDEILAIMSKYNLSPTGEAASFIIREDDESGKLVEWLLKIARQNCWIFDREVVEALEEWFEHTSKSKWKCERVQINSKVCPSCKTRLEPKVQLNREEYDILKSAFRERALLRSDVFQNTNPEELEKFTKFLEESGPFDVIMDGLNIAHTTYKNASVKERSKVLRLVVEDFALRQQLKVLVLGRRHMQFWSKSDFRLISEAADVFFLENVSKDDPFMIYGAFQSGQHTLCVTTDYLRDHSFLLGDLHLQMKFQQWQRTNQVWFIQLKRFKGRDVVKLKWPDRHETIVQGSHSGWHIPYDDGTYRAPYEMPRSWLCVQNVTRVYRN